MDVFQVLSCHSTLTECVPLLRPLMEFTHMSQGNGLLRITCRLQLQIRLVLPPMTNCTHKS